MINCKKHIIAIGFTLMLPLTGWSEAPVIDDSENFAFTDGQQIAEASAGHPKYDESHVENGQFDGAQNEYYQMDSAQSDDGPALVREDQSSDSNNDINNNAKLIDKIQALQQEIQELRGQLEVQAHDLKLLQQQQVAFYKDLDARLGNGSPKTAQNKPVTDITLGSKTLAAQPSSTATAATPTNAVKPAAAPQPVIAVSRTNPADEQISYLAAYELVKNKRYDNAINAMQTFVQKYPKGGYTANAEYWLGELYLVKKDYSKAIEHFEVVLHQFPASSKSAASLLKSGYAYAATGNNQEARKRFQQIIKSYPDTSTAQLASAKLKAIKTL
ncbi:tol-pal system protein YbgF [Legionella maioricensis]|uniref:Cell division coordinator CpoB n=1 Tax=Legionella maioricensis TaxID=2896528 RepID=A0A9X2I943_9GAMM|nr:tol-pal system protein YbgF [Legionella maioricensis]MCL9682790.1 tol-pal system protein YbgF [Legionella maioricensis]MCL9686582.1 tol-pal system protein YbgF [Legionella maioricensis]